MRLPPPQHPNGVQGPGLSKGTQEGCLEEEPSEGVVGVKECRGGREGKRVTQGPAQLGGGRQGSAGQGGVGCVPWRGSSWASGVSGAAPRGAGLGVLGPVEPRPPPPARPPRGTLPSCSLGGRPRDAPQHRQRRHLGPWHPRAGGGGRAPRAPGPALCGSHALHSAPGAPPGSARGCSSAPTPPGEDLAPLRPPLAASPQVPLADTQLAGPVPLG